MQLVVANNLELESHYSLPKLLDSTSHSNVCSFLPPEGKSKRLKKQKTKRINNLQYSPDGEHLATVSWDKSVIIWDTESWHAIKTIANENHVFTIQDIF